MKIKTLLASLILLSALPALADNYFTMGENDTLMVDPEDVGHFLPVSVNAHFDGRLDRWYVCIDYPQDLGLVTLAARSGMVVPYVTATNDTTTYTTVLTVNTLDSLTVSSHIPILGYWDYNHDDILEPYGTVKWEAGDHYDMFEMNFDVASSFTGGTVTFRGYVSAGLDARGGTVAGNNVEVWFNKTVTVLVGYKRGDVNGDGYVNINDVSELVNYLANEDGLDQYQLEAADFNRDGMVSLDDVTALTNYLLTNGNMSLDDFPLEAANPDLMHTDDLSNVI